jgi:spore germination protein KC
MTLYMFVAKGQAKDVLDVEPEFEKTPITEISKMLKDQKITSHAPIVTEFEFVSTMVSPTTSAVAPIVAIIEDDGKQRLDISGCAVFKKDTMCGELSETETRGLLFVKNKVKAGVIRLEVKGGTATVEIREASGKVTPVLYTDGTSEFNVTITTTVGLGDQSGTFNLSEPDNVQAMLDAARNAIRDEIRSAVDKSKELNADIFGFGEYLNRKYPGQWKQMKKKWDDLYKNVKINIDVKVKANGSGRIDKPLTPAED